MRFMLSSAMIIVMVSFFGFNGPHLFYANFQNSNENLLCLDSRINDGAIWTTLTCNYTPTPGHVVRDPYVMQINGKVWLAHTNITGFSTKSTSFDIASSTDCVNWTYVASPDMSAVANNTAAQVWSPTWFVDSDGSVHIFVSITNEATFSDNGFQLYETHPMNGAFTAWSTPILVTGTSLRANMIAPYMVKLGATYNLWYKDETAKFIEYMSSTSLTSGYTITKSADWAGWGSHNEGAIVLPTQFGKWRVYFDNEGNGIYYSDSLGSDWVSGWSVKALISAPYTPVNGGVIVRPSICP